MKENLSDDFQVFVKPVGARCNLNCDYCYYLEKCGLYPGATNPVMDDNILEGYIAQHMTVSTAGRVFFSWHGGEPLLAGTEFFRRVIELQGKYNKRGLEILNGIQTNGTLLNDEWGEFLSARNFIVGLSIDGPQPYHDYYRKRVGGTSAFSSVIKGLDILKRFRIPFELLCVVSNKNVDYPNEVYNFLKSTGTGYITFLPLVERDGEQLTVRSVDPLKFGRFLSVIFDEWKSKDIGHVKVQIFEEALRVAFGQDHSLCIFRKRCGGVPVLEINGDIYSCDHYVESGYLLGNIRHKDLNSLIYSEQQLSFGRAKEDKLPAYCRSCEVLDMCNGECPRNRFALTPDGEPGLNYLCPGYRLFFNHCRPFVNTVAKAWEAGRS